MYSSTYNSNIHVHTNCIIDHKTWDCVHSNVSSKVRSKPLWTNEDSILQLRMLQFIGPPPCIQT